MLNYRTVMADYFFAYVYVPMLSCLVAASIMLVGNLISLEIKQIYRRWRLKAERQARGPQGMAILVRGLGPHPEKFAKQSLSNNWTPSSLNLDTPALAAIAIDPPSLEREVQSADLGIGWRRNLGMLGSAGRG